MTGTVKAQVLTAPGRLEWREFPVPDPGENRAVAEVLACGLCGSDVASFQGSKDHGGPVILGHEVIGRIVDIGAAAARRWELSAGDRFAVEEVIPCMSCSDCRSGRHRVCDRAGVRYGDSTIDVAPSLWGGFAEQMVLDPRSQLHPVPDSIPDDVATLFIPLSNGLGWMRDAGDLRPGDTAVVFGAGQHGVASALAALHMGARRALVVGTLRSRRRLDLAASLGCETLALDPGDPPGSAVREHLGGPADVVMDMTPGAALPLAASIEVVARDGRVLWGGLKRGDGRAEIPVDEAIRKEVQIRGLWARPSWAIPAAFEWLAARPELARLGDSSYPLADLTAAFAAVTSTNSSEQPLHVSVVSGRVRTP